MRKAAVVCISDEDRAVLARWSRGRKTPARLVDRAKIVLLAADGLENKTIAAELEINEKTVGLWRRRFVEDGLAGIEKDAPRSGRRATVQYGAVEAAVVRKTTQEDPPNATHWSTRTMAAEVGISPASVRRIWKRNGLKPHLHRTFKVSNDPHFAEKLDDVVGLYLNPPENAIVFSVDEKSQIQALDRTQPGLPMKKGRCGTMTHDYKRNGTTTLFAAMCTLTGHVIGACMPKHRHQEWLKFLRMIDKEVPRGLDIHVIADNYSTHKHEKVKEWLEKHPRIHMHFTPTSASWMNMVERFFRDLTDKRLRRGVFQSVPEVIEAIEGYILHHNENPKPFIWTKKASDILEKVMRARKVLDNAATD
jgi:transposase